MTRPPERFDYAKKCAAETTQDWWTSTHSDKHNLCGQPIGLRKRQCLDTAPGANKIASLGLKIRSWASLARAEKPCVAPLFGRSLTPDLLKMPK